MAAAEKSLLDNSVDADFKETKVEDSKTAAKDRPPTSRIIRQEAKPPSRIDPYPNDPYPTFTAVEPPWISRLVDQTPKYLAAVQQYEAAQKQYHQDLADWRTRREKILERPLTGPEMYGIFDKSVSFPVPIHNIYAQPTAEAAAAAAAAAAGAGKAEALNRHYSSWAYPI